MYCIYCGLPLKARTDYLVVLEIPRGLLSTLAQRAVDSGTSGWHLVGELRRLCLEQPADEVARWAAWLIFMTLLGEICFDWSQPETFVRQIAAGKVDFDRLRDSTDHAFSVRRFYSDASPCQIVINPFRLDKLPDRMRDEADAVLGRYRNIEPERMQELRQKLAFAMMRHRTRYWMSWQRWATLAKWLWWLAVITLALVFLLARRLG